MASDRYSTGNYSTRIVAKHFNSNRAMRHLLGLTMLVGGNDDLDGAGNRIRAVRHGTNAALNFSTLSKFSEVVNAIDDRLDTMSPEDILAAGDTHVGPEICEFLRNDTLITPQEWQVFNSLKERNIFSSEDLVLFMNLFAQMHHRGAEIALKLRDDPFNVDLREQATEQHLRSAELCGIMLTHIYKREPLQTDGPASYEMTAKAYPDTVHISRVIEYNDDLMDFFGDYREELKSGTPNPNAVITAFSRIVSAMPADEKQAAIAELNDYVLRVTETPQHIRFSDIPHNLKLAMYDVVRKSETEARDLRHPEAGSILRNLAYNLSIDVVGSNLRDGWPLQPDKTATISR